MRIKNLKNLVSLILLFIVVGCASSSDVASVQTQIISLNNQLSLLQSKISNLQSELIAVKKQRVVRLPTGAPVQTRERSANKLGAVSDQEKTLFEKALSEYKYGNTKAALIAFDQFITLHPQSGLYKNALYYSASAHYSTRNYAKAAMQLEELVYQTPINEVNQKALVLLEKVYVVSGEKSKLRELKDFVRNIKGQ